MSSVFSTVQTPLLRGGALDGAEAGVCPLPGLLTKGHTPDPSQEGKRDGNTVVSSVFYTVQTPLLRGGALDGAEAGVCPFPDLFTKGHTPDPSQEGKRDGNGLSIFEDNIITLHPLHVSTSDISYNAKDGNLEVILSIYTDDFENAITKLYHTKTDLVKPELHTAMDALVKKYVAANLHIKAGNVDYPLNYVGFEINREAVNVYVETAKLVTPPKKIDVEVSLLHNLYNDQINIVHMTVAGVRKSGKLIFPDKAIGQVF